MTQPILLRRLHRLRRLLRPCRPGGRRLLALASAAMLHGGAAPAAQDPASDPSGVPLTPPARAGGSPAPVELASRIEGVTVTSSGASVRRLAELPAGGGSFVLAGLPASLDPDALQVRVRGAEIVSVEVRDGVRPDSTEARVAELQRELTRLEREHAGLRDERLVLERMEQHVGRLLLQEEEQHGTDLQGARVDLETWERNHAWLREKLAGLRAELREVGWREEELQLAQRELQVELGRCQAGAGVRVRDVLLDVVDTSGSPGSLELEYLVAEAGWAPLYDLRASKDLAGVELVYRAKVWQRSGEDWRDVEVVLSTAQPQRGARGPEPQPVWLSLVPPRPAMGKSFRGLGYAVGEVDLADDDAPAAAPEELFAQVSSEGISVRYRLPRRETIEARVAATTVLVGRASLAAAVEHYCVPALDTTVWLRGRARNTSPWVLLPGRAAVYFGADFVGHADLGTVQTGQELDLHLGPDPGLEVERVSLADVLDPPGLFGSRERHRERWRVRVTNHGGLSPRPDGRVDVIVHEVLPRSKDERVTVELADASPSPSDAPRWKRERTEKGVLTWQIPVARGAEATIHVETEIAYPEGELLARSR